MCSSGNTREHKIFAFNIWVTKETARPGCGNYLHKILVQTGGVWRFAGAGHLSLMTTRCRQVGLSLITSPQEVDPWLQSTTNILSTFLKSSILSDSYISFYRKQKFFPMLISTVTISHHYSALTCSNFFTIRNKISVAQKFVLDWLWLEATF